MAWRLFAINSEAQLFLYGDNLQFVNAITHYIRDTSFTHPLAGFIGSNGMLGAYSFSDPQASFFYLPITALIFFGKVFHFDASAIYYSMLGIHTAHLLMGTFAIYLAAEKLLKLPRSLAWLSGVVYLGLGWNVAWMDAGSLSFMIGWVPVVLYSFVRYIQRPTVRRLGWYLLAFILFLYAGGLINFFFYIWINAAALALGAYYTKSTWVEKYPSAKAFFTTVAIALIAVPVLALGVYLAQLVLTLAVSKDISHTAGTYDYLAFFSLKFSDLAGFIVPRFGLLGFGADANPQLIANDLGKEEYIGLLPLGIIALGAAYIREKKVVLLLALLLGNLVLAFGGMTALYHLAMLFPGNTMFRGHYKLLIVVGWYASLLVPLCLHWFSEHPLADTQLAKVRKGLTSAVWILLVGGMLSAGAIMAYSLLAKNGLANGADYLFLARTFSTYFFRTLIFVILSWYSLSFVLGQERKDFSQASLIALAAVLLLDTSSNYIYAQRYAMPIKEVANPVALESLKGKHVYLDIPGYTQAYLIPEVVGIDALTAYSPIPNAGLVQVGNQIAAATQDANLLVPLLQGAGVERFVTTSTKSFAGLELIESPSLTETYTSLYAYKANGSIHDEWGEAQSLKNERLFIYRVPQTLPQAVLSTNSRKVFQVAGGSMLTTAIPFSSLWKATSDGTALTTEKVNTAFIGVQVPGTGLKEVVLSVDIGRLRKGIYGSIFFGLLSIAGLYLYRRLLEQRKGLGHSLSKSI